MRTAVRHTAGMRAMGVDGCRAGWVGVVVGADGVERVLLAADIAALVAEAGPLAHVAIDIPVGWSGPTRRAADLAARTRIGPRRASVFDAPHPAVLDAPDWAEANRRSRALTGRGLSVQAWNLVPKIREVAAFLPGSPAPLSEVHPEVVFAALAGAPLAHPKTTWAGVRARHRLLAAAGLEVPDDIGPAGSAAVDDVLDAAAAAWTARRLAAGTAVPMPDPPERDAAGRPVAIWW